ERYRIAVITVNAVEAGRSARDVIGLRIDDEAAGWLVERAGAETPPRRLLDHARTAERAATARRRPSRRARARGAGLGRPVRRCGSKGRVEIVFVVIFPVRQQAAKIPLLVAQLDALTCRQTPACSVAFRLEAVTLQVRVVEVVVIVVEDREIEVVVDSRLGFTH